ncbi:MAG: molybdopterin dinucleotide binding domain-containing protein, partial [Candidatus Thorarchaeota archaeon]|nr:molybdopterin dinucleotide binding domain-containing protein [Candidatus Thorarchaeota archaeon]
DAAKEKIRNGMKVTLSTRRGNIKTEAHVTKDVPPGLIFIPFHFSEACANKLTNPVLDPACGMPEYKFGAVKIEVAK